MFDTTTVGLAGAGAIEAIGYKMVSNTRNGYDLLSN